MCLVLTSKSSAEGDITRRQDKVWSIRFTYTESHLCEKTFTSLSLCKSFRRVVSVRPYSLLWNQNNFSEYKNPQLLGDRLFRKFALQMGRGGENCWEHTCWACSVKYAPTYLINNVLFPATLFLILGGQKKLKTSYFKLHAEIKVEGKLTLCLGFESLRALLTKVKSGIYRSVLSWEKTPFCHLLSTPISFLEVKDGSVMFFS
jgi:hypothetical protein